MSAPLISVKPTPVRRIGAGLALLALSLGLALVDVSPTVRRPPRPSAHDINAAREVWRQLKDAQSTHRPARLRLNSSRLRAISSLAGDVSGIQRIDASLSRGRLVAAASVPLWAGLWLNASAMVTGKHRGFPSFRLRIGRVTFPYFVGRWFAELGRWVITLNGANVPPLDSLSREISINQNDLVAILALPPKSGLVDSVIAATNPGLDDRVISRVFCQLATEQRIRPVRDLSSLVRRAFSKPAGPNILEHNRATFVALAFVVVGQKAHVLAPKAADITAECPPFLQSVSLQGREDLAKHWTLSAALASVFGNRTAANLGEWKELSDSLPHGSGFSFVDLAADRSGARFALQGSDMQSAKAVADRLSRTSEHDLLPVTLLAAPEGLPEAVFKDDYGSLEEGRYAKAVVAIDHALELQEDSPRAMSQNR